MVRVEKNSNQFQGVPKASEKKFAVGEMLFGSQRLERSKESMNRLMAQMAQPRVGTVAQGLVEKFKFIEYKIGIPQRDVG